MDSVQQDTLAIKTNVTEQEEVRNSNTFQLFSNWKFKSDGDYMEKDQRTIAQLINLIGLIVI